MDSKLMCACLPFPSYLSGCHFSEFLMNCEFFTEFAYWHLARTRYQFCLLHRAGFAVLWHISTSWWFWVSSVSVLPAKNACVFPYAPHPTTTRLNKTRLYSWAFIVSMANAWEETIHKEERLTLNELTSAEASVCGLRAPLFRGQSEVKSSQQKDVRCRMFTRWWVGMRERGCSRARDQTVPTGLQRCILSVPWGKNVWH